MRVSLPIMYHLGYTAIRLAIACFFILLSNSLSLAHRQSITNIYNMFSKIQYDLFGNEYTLGDVQKKTKLEDYDGFLDKFANKLTTDDCYTPPAVYDAVFGWCRERYNISPDTRIMRPFKPGGDFQSEDYSGDCMVIDNPPFSILTKICQWYVEHGVRFFLFSPYLRSLGCSRWATVIVVAQDVIFENGAKISVSFVTNMEGDTLMMSAPDLKERIKAANVKDTVSLPKYRYPKYVLTEAMVGYMANHETAWSVSRKDASQKISGLDSQRQFDNSIFGGGIC